MLLWNLLLDTDTLYLYLIKMEACTDYQVSHIRVINKSEHVYKGWSVPLTFHTPHLIHVELKM